MPGANGVDARDHTCRAGGHSNMAWVAVSYGSPHLGK